MVSRNSVTTWTLFWSSPPPSPAISSGGGIRPLRSKLAKTSEIVLGLVLAEELGEGGLLKYPGRGIKA